MKSITTLITRNRQFEIVLNGTHYCAIEDKYIDADGRLNTALNGLQMHASEDLDQCIELTRHCVEIEYLQKNGYTWAEATSKVTGIPMESLPVVV